MEQEFYDALLKILPPAGIRQEEPMRDHTTFRIGGPARFFVMPETTEELRAVLALCQKEDMPFYVIGNGSNLLVSDAGYDGVVIQICRNMNRITVDGCRIRAKAGALLTQIAAKALDSSLTGFEFASGIPGTLGGACVMNAGAYGGEMKDVLEEVQVLTQDGTFKTLKKDELKLGYRTSVIAEKDYIVLEASLLLKEGDREQISGRMEELKERRVEKQPLEYPSAGSTFKRPEGHFAGQLIQEAGLRGFSVGGAQVSEKHCGFVINRDHATAADVNALMNQVIRRVKENSGVTLEPEVKKLGTFQDGSRTRA